MLGDLFGGVVDLVTGNKASNIARRATRKAGELVDEGYGSSIDLARPMQERSQADYMDLSKRYGEGGFRSPDQEVYQGGKFQFNPQDVFNDPEYQASMKAGTQALEGGAANKGMLFSGNTGRALQGFGQDLFAKRSDTLYNRGRSAFEDDRNFGFDAENRAYDANVANRARDFEQGSYLAGYAPGALDRSIDLNMGRAQAKADTELGVGNIRSNAYRVGGQKAGRLAGAGLDLAASALNPQKGLY